MNNEMPEKPFSMDLKHKILLIAISVLGTLLLLEIGLRIYDIFKGRGFFSDYRNELAEPMKPVLPFRTFGFELYKEQNGVRYICSRYDEMYPFEKSPGTYRIVCFGGSTTENLFQQKRTGKHYPLLLQNLLRKKLGRDEIEAINVGYSAYATPHSLILLELNVLDWKPDLVILSHNINDLTAMYWPGFSPDYSNKYNDPFFNIPDYRSRFTLANTVFQHFKIYWEVKRDIKKLKRHFRKPGQIKRKSYGDMPNPDFQKVFERNMKSFIALCKLNDVSVLLASQPICDSEEYFNLHFNEKTYNDVVVYPLHDEFLKHHHAYNMSIEKVAQDNDIWFIDNDKLMNNDIDNFIDSVHYSEMGLEILAGNYTDFILENKIIE